MVKVVVDTELRAKFAGVEEAELCDPSGRTLGHFLSDAVYRRLIYDWANAQISDSELQSRLQKPGGKQLAEILARLESSP